MGKSTISMAIFNSYVKLPEGNYCNDSLRIAMDPPQGHQAKNWVETGSCLS